MSANQSDQALLVSPQKQSANQLGDDDTNNLKQIQQTEGAQTQNEQHQEDSFDSQIHKNLNSLDEVMFHSSSTNKPRSTSINVNLVEGLRDHEKNFNEDVLRISKPSTFEGMLELQESVNCFPEGLSSILLNSKGIGTSVENDEVYDINDNLEAISKGQSNPLSGKELEETENKFSNKRKVKLPMIQLPITRTIHHRGNAGNPIMDASPIKEIQSDNSSYRENFNQSQQAVHVTTSTRSGYDNVEALQNDEFTLMFKSNCPIKSPILPRIKKKHIDHSSQQGSLSSSSKEDSLDKLKESVFQGLTDSSQNNTSKVNNTLPQIQSLAGISQVDILKKEENPLEEEVEIDLKQIERESIPINKDAVQYGLTDIKSVRNYKVNAFRNKLNLQSQQQQFQMNQECGYMNASGSQKNISLMNPPVSLMEMQKNQNYNTVETPIGGVGQRTMQRPRLTVPPLMHLGRYASAQESQKEQKECNQLIQEEGQNCAEIDGGSSKRKFQRQLLRIKVDPENSYNKQEENTETWDEVVSSGQGPPETILEPKARQGSSNFEDQYTIINERPLGEGTSGCVYQCVKKSDDDTIYAVKVMRNVDEEMSKSIFQTFGIQYRLQHESVSRVYEVYYNENSLIVHYVMEYIPFRSLDSLLRDKKRTLKETDSSQIVLKLLKAVCYMEQRGVCHRDLKPENILISEDLKQIKIIDFGISKSFVKSQRVQHITQYFKHKMYTPTGTPSYKAPEILLGAGYTQLIDMWDVGVIAYQLICKGQHPFKCETQIEQDQRILTQNFDQTDEYWIKASSNAKNFVKQLLRLNRYPAFEALKHPWIEQRKIDVSDDGNRNAAKLEKKSTTDTIMTISVPVHFQPRLFNNFNITATNSEQSLRGILSEDNSQVENQINSSNDVDCPSGNTNAQITNKQNKDGSYYSNRDNGSSEPIKKSNFGKQNSDATPLASIKKKHSIQSFSSTQDVVHVVMRQKLSESREQMMKFYLKANIIIKNLEEEQFKLEQNSLPGKIHKRTHSAEKQSEQPINNNPQGNSAVPNLGIDGLSLLSSGGIFGSSSRINSPLPNLSNSQEDIQRYPNSSSGTPGAGPGMQTSFHMSLFSKEAQNSFVSNKASNTNNIGNLHNLNNSNIQSEDGRSYNSQQQILQVPDFNGMKYSSLIQRKSSQQQYPSHAHANNNWKSKLIQRRNSTRQTNSMEMSINFTKDVIGELQQTFDNDESLKGEGTPSRTMKIADYENILKNNQNNSNNTSGNVEERTKIRGSQPSLFYPKQSAQGDNTSQFNKGKKKKALEDLMISQKDEEKWKLIAENMERSDSKSHSDDGDSSDSSSSSQSSDSSGDHTQSFDLDKFLIKQPAISDSRFSHKDEFSAVTLQPSQNQQNDQPCQNSETLERNLKESLSNFPQCFNKEPQSQSKPCSIVFQDAKNMGKISSGIFQSIPYVNYMSSSKDNFINKSLLEMQENKDDRHQQSAIVMTTSSASSKENSHHHQNHSAELPVQQQNQQSNQIQHSNSLAQIKSQHKHPHHTKQGKKNHKNTKIYNQKNALNPILQGSGQIQCNLHNKSNNNNQTLSDNCSSCGLPNSMQLQEQKSQDGGNEERLFKNKLAPIPKRCSNEISFNDSIGDQNLSFIDMNQSKLVQSFYPNSEDQIPINHSGVKKNNFLFSMNVSQTSSIIAGNISLSNSGNNNTVRSFHAPNSGIVGSGLNSNGGHGENAGGGQNIKERGNITTNNASKFKWQQSEQNSSGGSNSMLKKGGKMDIDMSVSQQISQGDIPLQMSQKPFLDNSALNSSYEATPSIHGQQQQQQQQQVIIGNADQDQNNNSQSDNSNNSKTSLPIAIGESKPVSQGSLSSLSSPQKRKPSGSQSGSGEVQNQPPQSKETSLNSNEEESNKFLENAIKITEPTQENDKNKRSNSRSSRNASPAGLKQSGYRGTFFQHLNQQTSNYSTIIEESGETRSYLNSSLAASSKQEFDGTTSMGFRFNQTRSLTQINQSILERFENTAQSLSINYNPSMISHQNSQLVHNQTIRSCEDSDYRIDDRQLSNSNDLNNNNSPFRRQVSPSGKKLSTTGAMNKHKHPGTPRLNSIKGSGANSKNNSPKVEKPQISQHSFDEFFGTMQKSAFFEEDLQQQPSVSLESHHHFPNVPLTSISEKEYELFSQERHYSDTTTLTEQPPLLKHRKSSLKGGAHTKENYLEAITEISKQTPEISSLQSPSTNNEITFHAAK